MHDNKRNGLRVSRCHKYIKAITGKKLGKNESPTRIAVRLLQENGAQKRGNKSVNEYLDECTELMTSVIKSQPKKPKTPSCSAFLESFAWRKVRMGALVKYGPRCMCCGATPQTGAVMNVDHIKPRKTHPELALSLENLQILCNECNHGKGNWDQTDWRGSW